MQLNYFGLISAKNRLRSLYSYRRGNIRHVFDFGFDGTGLTLDHEVPDLVFEGVVFSVLIRRLYEFANLVIDRNRVVNQVRVSVR